MRVAVMGGGSWGTTFGKVLADSGCPTTLWARRLEIATAINEQHINPEYLSDVRLPEMLRATADPFVALADAELVVLAVPAQSLRDNLTKWGHAIPDGITVVSLLKGVELGTAHRMSEVIVEVGHISLDRVCVLSGPNLAREVADEQPTATVVAGADHDRTRQVQLACRNHYFRPYTNSDVLGCELSGAIKNVIAMACGMAHGMGFCDNTKATLITRGLAETARLGAYLGADPKTFAGLAGLGDLVATCSSHLSRNRSLGERLGRGELLADALAATKQTTEGVKSCRSVLDLASRHGVEMPITQAVSRVCYEGLRPAEMIDGLMSRQTKPE